MVSQFKYLGFGINTTKKLATTYVNAALKRNRATTDKINKSALSRDKKISLIKAVSIPRSNYAYFSQYSSTLNLTSARSGIVATLWPGNQSTRCAEVVLGVLNKPCEVDPLASGVFQMVRGFARVIKKNRNIYPYL